MFSCENDSDLENQQNITEDKPTAEYYERVLQDIIIKYPSTNIKEIMKEAEAVDFFRGKTIAYLGASLVNLPECGLAQYLVEKALGCKVVDYGHGGFGYASKHNLQKYAARMAKHDVYVLWGSTNDYGLNVPVGNPTDYTAADNYDVKKLKTVCGGMNYSIKQVYRINPEALLLGYTTVKMFNGVRTDGSLRSSTNTNRIGFHFYDYVDAQLACFKYAKAPCLNVWDWDYFTHGNRSEFYMQDGVHMKHSGYFFLAMQHLKFLIKIAEEKSKTGM